MNLHCSQHNGAGTPSASVLLPAPAAQQVNPRKSDENCGQPQNLLAMAYDFAASDKRQHDSEAGDHHPWGIPESFHFLVDETKSTSTRHSKNNMSRV